jgi:hypothetical protein
MQAKMKSEQEKAEKMISAVQQVMNHFDEHGNFTETKSETQSQSISTSDTTTSTSSSHPMSQNKKQKILHMLERELDLTSESESESKHNCVHAALLTQTQNEMKKQQNEMKKQQTEMKQILKKFQTQQQTPKSAPKSKPAPTKTRSRLIRRSPTPTIEVEDENKTTTIDNKTELTPEQQREYDEKWNKKVEELTQRFSGPGARQALEAEIINIEPKIMFDKDMGVMIKQLATALMH